MLIQQKDNTKFELPSASLPGSGVAVQMAQAHLNSNRQPSTGEVYVQDKLRTDLANEIGTIIKADFGQQVVHTLNLRTERRFVEFIEVERSILLVKRHEVDQRDLEAFLGAVRQYDANDMLDIREAGAEQVRAITKTPLTPPEEEKEDIVIERASGLLGWLGGQQVRRIKR